MTLMAICPVCGRPMPVYWPGTYRIRHYCSEHCRSKGTMLARLENERAEMDEAVVLRLMKGDHIQSTQAERMEAALRLSRQVDTGMKVGGGYRMGRWGNVVPPKALMTYVEIAFRIGVAESTARRYLHQMAEPQSVISVKESKARILRMYARTMRRTTLIGWQITNEGNT